jgi:hypothetical protein
MGVRWYSVVVDCLDAQAQGDWWAEALGWTKVHEIPGEVTLAAPHAVAAGDSVPVEERHPGLVFKQVTVGKTLKNRLHLDLAPPAGDDQTAEVDRLVRLGATRVAGDAAATWVSMTDPEGNEFCVNSPRDS